MSRVQVVCICIIFACSIFNLAYWWNANTSVVCNPKPKQTNADKIRAMTDEELADFLDEKMPGEVVWGWKSWREWLKQEAKE